MRPRVLTVIPAIAAVLLPSAPADATPTDAAVLEANSTTCVLSAQLLPSGGFRADLHDANALLDLSLEAWVQCSDPSMVPAPSLALRLRNEQHQLAATCEGAWTCATAPIHWDLERWPKVAGNATFSIDVVDWTALDIGSDQRCEPELDTGHAICILQITATRPSASTL